MSLENQLAPIVLIDNTLLRDVDSDCDCSDCACSLSAVSEVFTRENLGEFLVKATPSHRINLNSEFTLCYSPYHQPCVLNQSAQRLLDLYASPSQSLLTSQQLPDSMLDSLTKLRAIGLLHNANQIPVLQEKTDKLSAWIHVTDRCNLRCAYCYLPHIHSDMDLATGQQVIEAIFRSAISQKYKIIKLKYAGGEPLLQFSLIQQLHKFAQELAEQNQVRLEGVILSNGTLLTKSLADSINNSGLKLMISLDGQGEIHDDHRPYASGRGTFRDVQKGIKIAKEAGVRLTISITISDKNANQLFELVRWILSQKLYFTLNFYRQNERAKEDLSFQDEQIIQGVLAAYKEIENNLPEYSLLNAIVDRANLSAPHLRTCGVGQNYLVFDPKGRVTKCQMHLYAGPENRRTEEPLHWIRASKEGILNLSVEEKDGCNECQWKYWCGGGCPLLTYQTTGKFNTKSPNCRIYKAIYPEAMRLEGLRLLKINKLLDKVG